MPSAKQGNYDKVFRTIWGSGVRIVSGFKSMVGTTLASRGYELVRDGHLPESIYPALVRSIVEGKPRAQIAIVGANDGKINDPLYPIIHPYAEAIDLLLVEPQPALIPFLHESYKHVSGKRIFNGAVSAEGELQLYTIRPSLWPSIKPPYAKGWPDYRAPTGVTSSTRQHVIDWLNKYVPHIDAEAAVEMITVPAAPLQSVAQSMSFPNSLDILQVDTEGADDIVLMNCNLEVFRPSLIRFERTSLPPDRLSRLQAVLRSLNYAVFPVGRDALAIRSA